MSRRRLDPTRYHPIPPTLACFLRGAGPKGTIRQLVAIRIISIWTGLARARRRDVDSKPNAPSSPCLSPALRRIAFVPSLSGGKQRAIRELRYEPLSRVALQVRARPWAWAEDPWAGGAHAWLGPGQFTTLMPHVATIEGRIHFAGEHTSAWHGWMQGALESGRRAAREIDAVPLDEGQHGLLVGEAIRQHPPPLALRETRRRDIRRRRE